MNKINIQYYKKYGFDMIIGSYKGKLCLLDYLNREKRDTIDRRIQKILNTTYTECDDEILQKTRKQLNEYFEIKRKKFDIPFIMLGSDFQKSVWESLLKIPYGETSVYKVQAESIGNKKAVRAVANANGANAIAIIIPCHRIIGSNGKLTGYSGGLSIKKKLLELEQIK